VYYWTKLVPKFHQVGEMSSVALRMRTADKGSSIMVHTDIYINTQKMIIYLMLE
jgi:hypothetical protein